MTGDEENNVDGDNAPYIKLEVDTVQHEPKDITIARFNPKNPNSDMPLIFAHGAGGSMLADAVSNFRDGFAASQPFICFQGSMNLKSRVKSFHAVAADQAPDGVVLGGRSMGARAAVVCANESQGKYKQLILVSYPLHTEKKGELEMRDQILLELAADCEVLFVSGENDSMCDLEKLQAVRLKMACTSWLVVVKGANHGMDVKPKAATADVGVMTGTIGAKWLHDKPTDSRQGIVYWDGANAAWSEWAKTLLEVPEDPAVPHAKESHGSNGAEGGPDENDDGDHEAIREPQKKPTKAAKRKANAQEALPKAPKRGKSNGTKQSEDTKAKPAAVESKDVSTDAVSSRTRHRKPRQT